MQAMIHHRSHREAQRSHRGLILCASSVRSVSAVVSLTHATLNRIPLDDPYRV
jgi:hypothetical protein